jgi:hypothetical protein
VTASVSATELADLLAGLGLTAPTAAAPPAEPRCTITELLTSACSHCRPTPPPAGLSRDRLGPWFAGSYGGTCTSCGGRFETGDRIRADGDGGYLGDCCGNIDPATPPVVDAQALIATATQMTATAAGPPPSTVDLMRGVLADLDASRPRSQQKRIGPSELGTPCQRQLAMKLADVPRQPQPGVPWAPMQGTAVHGLMEEALRLHNTQLGRPRWVIEERLHMDDEISGSGDAFDTDTDTVVDWKFVGTTALREVRRKTIANHLLVKPDYRIQAHLYGLGHERAGRTVRWVRLVFLARSHDYSESAEWTEAYDPDIAIKALARYYGTQDLIAALNLTANPDMWELVPAEPGKACAWCPFRRVGGPADDTGCPGDTQTKIGRQLAGLIA